VKHIFYYLILSITAAFLLLILAFFSPSNVNSIELYDKLFISGLFIIICIFGISLAFYPGWYRRITNFGNYNKQKQQTKKAVRKREGHHPDCNEFKNHSIKIKNKILCAGCLGLAIGSAISIFLMILYIFIENNQSSTIFQIIAFLGLIMIFFTFVEIMFPLSNAVGHVVSNIILVIGFLLITISIFEITGNKIYGAITVLFSFLWLDTRIHLSNWRHTLICNNCDENCKMY